MHLAQHVHSTLASLAKVIKGTQLLTNDVEALAVALMRQQVPSEWSSLWDSGPEDPVQWLTALMSKTLALTNWEDKAESNRLLSSTLDLSDLFHPDTFLNALRQQTARLVPKKTKYLLSCSTFRCIVSKQSFTLKERAIHRESFSFCCYFISHGIVRQNCAKLYPFPPSFPHCFVSPYLVPFKAESAYLYVHAVYN